MCMFSDFILYIEMPIITPSVTLQMFCKLTYPLSHVDTETNQPPMGCTCNLIFRVYVFLLDFSNVLSEVT